MATDTEMKTEVIDELQARFLELSMFIESIDENKLFEKIPGKWNIAQQTDHLAISNTAIAIGFNTPKIGLKTLFGTSERGSIGYDEVVFRYQSKLNSGAKASFAFQPRLSILPKKKLLLNLWNRSAESVISAARKWKDEELDVYRLSHPILGKVTMREMLHFSVYHVQHHLKSMKELVK
jgi:hypothetical protein